MKKLLFLLIPLFLFSCKGLQKALDAAESENITNQSQLTKLRTQVKSLETKNSNLEGQVKEQKGDIDNYKSMLTTEQNRLRGCETTRDSTTGLFIEVNTKLNSVSPVINSLTSEWSTVDGEFERPADPSPYPIDSRVYLLGDFHTEVGYQLKLLSDRLELPKIIIKTPIDKFKKRIKPKKKKSFNKELGY